MEGQNRLKGKVAIVSGSTAGIGKAIAIEFAKQGAKVVVTGRRVELGEKVVEEIKENKGEAIFVKLDVTKEDEWKNAVDTAVKTFGKLDVAVNNAAFYEGSLITNLKLETYMKIHEVTNVGVLLGTKYAAESMKTTGGGSIINVSSAATTKAFAFMASYTSAKAGMEAVSDIAAVEYAPFKVRVNKLIPGYTKTDMLDEFFATFTNAKVLPSKEAALEVAISGTPLGFIADPLDVALPAVFLASDESRYVTGVSLIVDGGVHLK